jgi:hypothetical protein
VKTTALDGFWTVPLVMSLGVAIEAFYIFQISGFGFN